MEKSHIVALATLCLAACGQSSMPDDDGEARGIAREDKPGLTQAYAEFRAQQVANVRYRLVVELDPALDFFSGENTISFDRRENLSDLTIDFGGGAVSGVIVNGTNAEYSYNESFITLAASDLLEGHNEVVVRFSHAWSDDGAGLYRYDDPDDGNPYFYTDFEPYDANSAFPLFDQPDIKGRFTLVVTAPVEWQVVSTSRESSIEQATESMQSWLFPETPPIPTYVMSLHAGPYFVWEDSDFRIPLRLFVRESMAGLVAPDTAMWFEYTRAGFDYFEEYYGVDYPYGKYDQIIVPDFNAGAMENAAAVTFNERSFVQRDDWTYKERKNLAMVILHEMAHMWFGDLVTMKWWNGLWLNETFATFMAYHAVSAKLNIDDAWEGFFADRKYAAYWADQRSTTHPVETPVADTDAVGANFDSISYAKGAAVIRQIEYRLGPEIFQRGINRYLTLHAEGNAELQDFVSALEHESGIDLQTWAAEWLYSAGANTIEARFSCEDGKVTDFALFQSAPEDYPILRTQKIQVGFFRDIDGVVTRDAVIPITYSGASTELPAAVGKNCPDLVYPNYGDLGYVLVKLDPRTRSNLKTMLGRLDDSFQRVMFWQTLWDNVRFAQVPVTDFLDAVFTAAAHEDDINNVDQVYYYVRVAIHYLRHMQDAGADALAMYRPKAEAVTWANIERTRGDLQTMYLDRYLGFVSANDGLEKLVDLLTGEADIPGRELDQERRWTMLRVLSNEGHGRVADLLAIEKERDPSDDGRRSVVAVEAAWPDIEVKRVIIDDIINIESENSYAMQRIAIRAMFPEGQEQLHEMFADEIMAKILQNEKEADPDYYSRARGFAFYLMPAMCSAASVERLKLAIAAHEDSRTSIKNYFSNRYEDDALCVARAALIPDI